MQQTILLRSTKPHMCISFSLSSKSPLLTNKESMRNKKETKWQYLRRTGSSGYCCGVQAANTSTATTTRRMMKSMKPSTVASTYCHPRTKSTTTLAATKITPNSHKFMHQKKKKKQNKPKKKPKNLRSTWLPCFGNPRSLKGSTLISS
jgi:hypothetical protein